MICYHCLKPFQTERFDFADPLFESIAKLGERFAKDTNLKENEWKSRF
jgi:hypothetical protein